jgi:hypothetical protein
MQNVTITSAALLQGMGYRPSVCLLIHLQLAVLVQAAEASQSASLAGLDVLQQEQASLT